MRAFFFFLGLCLSLSLPYGLAADAGRPLRKHLPEKDPLPERFALVDGAFERGAPRSGPEKIGGLEAPLTAQYIRRYSRPEGLRWIAAALERGAVYLGFIRAEIARRGLPEELLYLPVIESEYRAQAVSKSGAAGLWQFMQNSIAPFDMKVTKWADQRLDFWKSTQGALRKLEENYRLLGDWPLALAAYNAGAGAITRILKETKEPEEKTYWSLAERDKLKPQTAHYVPKLLAVAHIAAHPRQYGLKVTWPQDPRWTRIPVKEAVDLELLAEKGGLDRELLLQGNGELTYAVTPPGEWEIKVPAADAEAARAVLSQAEEPLVRYYYYTINSGDTLSALAQHYGVGVDHIVEANPGIRPQYLKIGATVKIPAFKKVEPYVRPASPAVARKAEGAIHLVKRGETLWTIARAYQTDPQSLAAANGMGVNDVLQAGRLLKLPIE